MPTKAERVTVRASGVYLQVAMWTDASLYGPQIAAVAIGLVAAVTGIPRDLPRPFGVVTALVGVVALVAMDRWIAAGCTDDGCSGAAFSITWIGYQVSWILPLIIIAASIADMIRFLRHRPSNR